MSEQPTSDAPAPGEVQKVGPQPVPITWTVGHVNDQMGRPWLALIINSLNGEFTFFLAPPDANRFAAMLGGEAAKASGGLLTPPAAGQLLIPPGANGHRR